MVLLLVEVDAAGARRSRGGVRRIFALYWRLDSANGKQNGGRPPDARSIAFGAGRRDIRVLKLSLIYDIL